MSDAASPSGESDVSTSMVPAEWENDKEIKACGNCEKLFGMTRRKHHCRCCGRIYCNECSPHKDEVSLGPHKMGERHTSRPPRSAARRAVAGGGCLARRQSGAARQAAGRRCYVCDGQRETGDRRR